MEKDVATYVRKHTFLLTVVVVVAFLLLAFGEYFLYRKIMLVNRMVSEGFMQIKEMNEESEIDESRDVEKTPTKSPTLKMKKQAR